MTGAFAGEYRPALHPAGLDDELRVVVDEVRMGRWRPMGDLLARTGADWALRTQRSQILASAAVRSRAVREWLREEPRSVDALMMQARVGTETVLRAHRAGHEVAGVVLQARQAALSAAQSFPQDPVPWVCLLGQATIDVAVTIGAHRMPPPDPMLPPGPWGLLEQVWRRDPFNREAHHRVLQVLAASHVGGPGAGVNYAHWLRGQVPAGSGSPLLVLPLFAYAEHYRHRRGNRAYDVQGHIHWSTEAVGFDIDRALQWFRQCDPAGVSPLDLNHLAHAAWAGRRYAEAAPVFEMIGPHMTARPWTYMSARPDDADLAVAEFSRARRQCLSVAEGSQRAGPGP
ncbi:hypothetical protein [Actinacidiphila paucisporea]|uniref:DUF4034 domain-containing protein n=1 Tax=Actinacidiphila paucisporea TaxID=310782 RepID=A0A1M6YKN1_9ACTN|nr:hypothetical protein [Actinacidiphila paucisporea]SHL18625.1 hypothetical protein SAMN05216499_10321 [Actinacidiphila paucisporea]